MSCLTALGAGCPPSRPQLGCFPLRHFSLAVDTVSSRCYMGFSVCVCVLISSAYKDNFCLGLGLTSKTSFDLIYLFQGLISKYTHTLRGWGLEFQQMNLCGGYHAAVILPKPSATAYFVVHFLSTGHWRSDCTMLGLTHYELASYHC